MPSSNTISTARAYVAEQLRAVIPAGWEMVDYLAESKKLSKVGVYLEYTRIETVPDLPPGQVRVVMHASVIDPQTDTKKGELAADDEVVELVLAVDRHAKITWTEAEKLRLPTGELGWRVTLSIIASTT